MVKKKERQRRFYHTHNVSLLSLHFSSHTLPLHHPHSLLIHIRSMQIQCLHTHPLFPFSLTPSHSAFLTLSPPLALSLPILACSLSLSVLSLSFLFFPFLLLPLSSLFPSTSLLSHSPFSLLPFSSTSLPFFVALSPSLPTHALLQLPLYSYLSKSTYRHCLHTHTHTHIEH